ncbi:non-ribosomal peptide synthetase [Amycolatopsis sp. BJA-103]|uniref:non-ribosomal peptide synthetase n=1 Tax=Amycolatopsis sp. BJA-103 TaxID=1911175 RepID=UPI000C765AF7|nr:non-ribosomal peptide synthetase [Amycolatopsis sp. BJA-103]AUI58400.1 hypothetical protein BKN51_09325 [Amycolatopsis sp. BJA-103]PNE13398.1 hypothetical protein B1H26_40760 [Amycolatopsis sp. BJA-103]
MDTTRAWQGEELACVAPASGEPAAAARIEYRLCAETVRAVRAQAESLGIPEFEVLLGAFAVLLETHGAGRDLFLGNVHRRLLVDPLWTVRELLVQQGENPADSSRRARYAFSRDLGADDGVELEIAVDGDLVSARYQSELLPEEQVRLLLARYETVLSAVAEDPERRVGDLPWWSAKDHEIISAANDTARPVEPASVLEAVHTRAVRAPETSAVGEGDRFVDYGQLWHAAVAQCAVLREAGIGPGDRVAISLPRGPELVTAVLGTWLAGAAYVPLDAAHPEDRIRYQLADSGAKILIAAGNMGQFATSDLAVLSASPAEDALPADHSAPPSPDPASCAYLIYTSGSTGRPKGTLITHGALANVASHFARQLDAGPADTMLWTTTFAFDMSGVELFVSLVSGCRLAAAPDPARSDGRVLRELVERYDARFVQATPTTWRLVLDRMADCLRGRSVITGGEPVPVSLARRLLTAGCVLHHAYGPTETAIWSTSRVIADDPGPRLDVGGPIANTQVHVVDRHDRELPVGVRGELCISGAGVAIGYHDRPELNAARFGVHPVHGRFYRTGDLAGWRADGTLDLFGRGDRQVKLRGNRIELGEIETTLLAHPEVAAAAVLVVGDPTADAVLVGCLEPSGSGVDLDSVREHLSERLPASMTVGELLVFESIPINANGKVDYPALDRSLAERPRTAGPASAPGSGSVQITDGLIEVWRTVLRRDDVDEDTDFFAHGGNSMLAAVAMQELHKVSGVSVGLTEFFECRTPRALAERVPVIGTALGR